MDGLLETWLMAFGLVLARVSAFIATIPYLGGRYVPRFVKAGAALTLSCFWFLEAGAASSQNVVSLIGYPWMAFVIAILVECVIGCSLGFLFGLFLVPFQVAGAYISQEMGLTLGTITDPTRPQVTTIISEIFELFGVLVFFTQNIHHIFLVAIHSSFVSHPLGSRAFKIPVEPSMKAISSATEWGLTLASPVACCLFITSFVIALMAKAAPQLNVMSFGFSLRILVGLLATFVLWPELVPQMTVTLHRYSEIMMGP